MGEANTSKSCAASKIGFSRSRSSNIINSGNNNNKSSSSSSSKCETQVVLNVYDLTSANNYSVWLGLGIFHSGIEVHGMEYGFGAHDYPISGVFEVEPRTCPGFIYRCSITLGCIKMPQSDFRKFIESVASEYHGDTYHLISKNCNHFTDDIAWRLTGKRIPGWVNRLARVGAFCSCLLPESLQVTTVKQLPEYHNYTDPDEDGSDSSSTGTPKDPTQSEDGNQNKHLLPQPAGSGEVAFIKEVTR